jgi:hypothetical protein
MLPQARLRIPQIMGKVNPKTATEVAELVNEEPSTTAAPEATEGTVPEAAEDHEEGEG